MEVQTYAVGPIATNCYFLIEESTRQAAVIDPGDNAPLLLEAIDRGGLKVAHILLTHGHWDHINALKAVREHTGAPISIGKAELELYRSNLARVGASGTDLETPENLLEDGGVTEVGSLSVHYITTPGHTAGSGCYLCGGHMFSGDTLFHDDIGRTDLPTGDPEQMKQSLKKLASLEGDYQVHPGHEEGTTLEYERRYNPYFQR